MRFLKKPSFPKRRKRKVASDTKVLDYQNDEKDKQEKTKQEKPKVKPPKTPQPPIPGVVMADMSPMTTLQEKCQEVDLEIKARQEEFGVDLYNLLEKHEQKAAAAAESSRTMVEPPDTFLRSFQDQWSGVKKEIEVYTHKQQQEQLQKQGNDGGKKKKKWRGRGSSKKGWAEMSQGENIIIDTWVLSRKRRFGVECFDTAFEVLGTNVPSNTFGGEANISTLSPQERTVSDLVQEAVQDVLLLERLKESYAREAEDEVTHHSQQGGFLLPFCGVCCY